MAFLVRSVRWAWNWASLLQCLFFCRSLFSLGVMLLGGSFAVLNQARSVSVRLYDVVDYPF
jgi:hypothetical protein